MDLHRSRHGGEPGCDESMTSREDEIVNVVPEKVAVV